MSPIFTRDEMRENLRRQNVGESAIARTLAREFGPDQNCDLESPLRVLGPTFAFPFRLVVPWSLLCSDNDKETGGLVRRGTEIFPRKVLTARYKTAKAAIRDKAKLVMGGARETLEPLSIRVDVWLPPARRNDAINFAKVVGDALEGVVYANDNQLHESHWYRRGVDIDAPRAEISIAPVMSGQISLSTLRSARRTVPHNSRAPIRATSATPALANDATDL